MRRTNTFKVEDDSTIQNVISEHESEGWALASMTPASWYAETDTAGGHHRVVTAWWLTFERET